MLTREDRLMARADAILNSRGTGLGEPILWHLAMRGYGAAMLTIANRMTYGGTRDELGRVQDAFSPVGLTYRAFRRGVPEAAQNMALHLFNVGDLAGYRYWMRVAARVGDTDAKRDVKRYETRLPHNLARRIGRIRPYRRDGS